MTELPHKRKRSGGPKSEAGKLAVSQNAIKTGSYSSMVILPGEDEADFKQLHEDYVASFTPSDVVESSLVYDLTVITWKKLRLERLEHLVFLNALNAQPTYQELMALNFDKRYHWLITKLDGLTQDRIEESELFLNFILSSNIEHFADPMVPVIPKEMQNFLDRMREIARDKFSLDLRVADVKLFSKVITNDKYWDEVFWRYAVRKIKQESEEVIWVQANLDSIQDALQQIKEKRLLSLMEMNGSGRAREDLNLHFLRALNELRRHQQWRQSRSAIEVSPE